ncbi:hypothetical protein [Klebsiella aerogenes]|uniref:hypothetical protein n=3 Tax=Gammaproteobacteria TaxID=1236 RepID=UPI003791F047
MDTLTLTADWDLDVDVAGNWATVGDSTPGELTGPGMRLAQDVATRCLSWRGEVYYDADQGIRYEQILGQAPNMALVQSTYATEALKVPGCAQAIPNFAFTAGRSRNVSGALTVADFSGNAGEVLF